MRKLLTLIITALALMITFITPFRMMGQDTYSLYSGNLVEGDYLIVYSEGAMNNTVASGRLGFTAVTISDNNVTGPAASIIWHISQSGDYWTIYNEEVQKYAAGTGVKNKAQLLESGTDDKSLWTVTGSETFDFVNKANAAANVNSTLRRNGDYGYACYSTSTGGPLSLYKKNTSPNPTVSTPTFTPAAGTYYEAQNVTIACATDEATIYFTLDGTDPTTASAVYSSPIAISETTTVKAMAAKEGMNNSNIATATYTIEEAPTPITIAEARALGNNQYALVQGVVTFMDGRNIYIQDETAGIDLYLNNGTVPSNLALGDMVLANGKKTVYNGLIELTAINGSNTSEFSIVSNGNELPLAVKTIAEILADHNGDKMLQSTRVQIVEATIGAINTNNNTPITQGESTMNIYKMPVVEGLLENDIVTVTGIIGCYNNPQLRIASANDVTFEHPQVETVATPTFNPAEGSYIEAQNVTIECATEGATIYYTLDGTNPTINSTVYSAPIAISQTTTVKAFGVKEGMDDSNVATAVYTFPVIYENIAAWKADHTASSQVVSGISGDITAVYQNGNTLYVQDATAGLLIYGNVGKEYNNGDIISGGIYGKSTLYSGTIEFIPTSTFPEGVAGAAVEPTLVTASTIDANFDTYAGRLVKLEGITFDADHTFATNNTAGRTTTFTQGSTTLTCYDSFKVLGGLEVTAGEAADIIGLVGCFNTTKQIFPRSINDIIIQLPTYYNVTIAEGITNGTVSADPLSAEEGATISVTATPATGYELTTLTYSYGETTNNIDQTTMQFVMPASDVIINATFTLIPTVETPTFTPAAGTYNEAQNVVIACTTAGAAIHYTLDGTAPTVNSAVYSEPIAISETTTVKAMAVKAGYNNSEVATAVYIIKYYHNVTIAEGIENGTVTVDPITAIEGTTINVTATPNETYFLSTLTYTYGETTNNIDQTTMQFAMPDADVVVNATFSMIPTVAAPTFTPAAGTYNEAQSVVIACETEGATIHYTLDGTDPTVSSTVYSAPIAITETTTVKAMAAKEGMLNSSIVSAVYTINYYYNVIIAEGITNGTVTVDPMTALEGTTINVTATPVEGYELETLTYSDGENTINIDPTTMQFVMPATDVVVNATFSEIPPTLITIAEARALANNEYALVQGVVTFMDGRNIYIQDETAGIDLYLNANTVPEALAQGDMVLAYGSKTDYKGLVELQYIDGGNENAFSIISSGNELPLAVKTIAEILADHNGDKMMQSTRVQIVEATIGAINTNSNTPITQDGNTLNIYKMPVVEGLIENDIVTVTGIIGCYNAPQLRVATAADVTFEHPIVENVDTPTFAPNAGTYYETQNVTIACATEGATIYYTLDGTDPTANSTVYTTPIVISETTTVKAFAVKEGMIDSEIATAVYTITEPPTPSDYARIYDLSQLTNGSKVVFAARYNGNANEYYAMTAVASGKPTGVLFTSAGETLPTTITDEESTYYWTVAINGASYTFTNANGDVLGYTSSTNFATGGDNTAWAITFQTSEATAMVPNYSAFVINNVNNESRAIALNSNHNFGPYHTQNLNADNYNFFIDMFATAGGGPVPCAMPTFTPAAGTYFSAQTVTINCATEGASIYYTLDGTDPTTASTLYSAPLTISETTTVKAMAAKEGFDNSNIATAVYTISDGPTVITIAEARALANNEYALVQGVVTFMDGRNIYIQDETAGIDLFLNNNTVPEALALGDMVLAYGKKSVYNGLVELSSIDGTNPDDFSIVSNGNELPVAVKTIAEILADAAGANMLQSTRVQIVEAIIGEINLSNNTPITQEGNTLNIYKIPAVEGLMENDIVTVTGVIGCYNNPQLRVALASDVTFEHPTEPTLVVAPTTMSGFSYYVDYGPSAQQSLNINGFNLNENVTITASGTAFEMSLTSGDDFNAVSSIVLAPEAGAVSQNIYVRLAAGLAEGSYAETITVDSQLDDITVDLVGNVYEAGDSWNRIYSVADLHDGDQVIIAARYSADIIDGYYAMPAQVTDKPNGVLFTSLTEDGIEKLPGDIANDADTYKWNVVRSGNTIKMVNVAGDTLGYGGSGTNFAGNVNTSWYLTNEVSGANSLVPNYTGFTIINTEFTNRGVAHRNTEAYKSFGAYSTSNQNNAEYNCFLDLFVQGGTGTLTVSTPIFSMQAGTYFNDIDVEIMCTTEGATIYYTLDGTDPTTSSSVYSSAIHITETTTLKAFGVKEGFENSNIATAEYVIEDAPTIITIAAAKLLALNEYAMVQGVVTFVDGRNVYIQDETAGIVLYLNANTVPEDLAAGDMVVAYGKRSVYNGLIELNDINGSDPDKFNILSSGNTLPLATVTIAEILADYAGDNMLQSTRVEIVEATIGAINNNNNTPITQDGSEMNIYKMPVVEGLVEGDIVTIIGVIGCYNNPQMRIASADDVEFYHPGGDPTLTVSTNALSGFTYAYTHGPSAAQTFTVSGENLPPAPGGTGGGVRITCSNSHYEFSLDGEEYWHPLTIQVVGNLEPTTVYVRLEAGLPVGQWDGVITLEDGGLEVSVTVSGSVTPNTGIDEVLASCVSIWNNSNEMMIENNTDKELNVVVYNIVGQPVLSKTVTTGSNVIRHDLVEGVYIVRLANGKEMTSVKVLVRR